MMKRVLLSLLITSCFALPMSGSQSTYNGPTLHDTYEGPLVVANSQLRYLGRRHADFRHGRVLGADMRRIWFLCARQSTPGPRCMRSIRGC